MVSDWEAVVVVASFFAFRGSLMFPIVEIKDVKRNGFLKFLVYFTDAIAILIEVAAILSAVLEDWVSGNHVWRNEA
jgi:hypothetical protein